MCRQHRVDLDGRVVADMGSGTGYLLRVLAREHAPARLVGYGPYDDIRALARFLCPEAELLGRDFLDEHGVRYDVVFATELLEHMLEPDRALRHLLRLTAQDGWLVLTVPDGRLDTFPALEPYENARGYWGHVHFWSPESWPLFLRQAAPDREIVCGQLPTGQNYAVLRSRAATGRDARRLPRHRRSPRPAGDG